MRGIIVRAAVGLHARSTGGGRMRCLQRLEEADLLLFDGTFWSDDELIRVQGSGSTAREMGHIPVSGAEGSLRKLAGLRHPRKVFVHVNNTNPMLDESGPEYRGSSRCGLGGGGGRMAIRSVGGSGLKPAHGNVT